MIEGSKEEEEKISPDIEAEKPIYCICKTTFDQGFMICCDKCSLWCHGSCVGMDETTADDTEPYLCPNCAPVKSRRAPKLADDHGRRTSNRKRKIHNYSELNDGSLRSNKQLKAATNFKSIMLEKKFSQDNIVKKMQGSELTKEFLASEGFCCPTLVENRAELDMVMPPPSFTVKDVRDQVGEDHIGVRRC